MEFDYYEIAKYYSTLKKEVKDYLKNTNLIENKIKVENDFYTFLMQIKVFLLQNYDTYYSIYFYLLEFSVSFSNSFIAYIDCLSSPLKLVVSSINLVKLKSVSEVIYVICHEIEHVLLLHPYSNLRLNKNGDKEIQIKLNIAMDASVNDRLDDKIDFNNIDYIYPPSGVIKSNYIAKLIHYNVDVYRSQSFYYYYKLIKNIKIDVNDPQFLGTKLINSNINGILNGEDGDGNGKEEEEGYINEDKIYKNIKKFFNDGVIEINKNYCKSKGKSSKNRGTIPGSIKELIELQDEKILSWKEILSHFVGTYPANKRKSSLRLNRREPYRFDLKGQLSDRVIKICVVVDTSGSITKNEFSYFISSINAILKLKKYVVDVIACDAKIQAIYNNLKKAKDIEFKGRGGTILSSAIDYINKCPKYRKHLIIFFTDGYIEHKIPKILSYRNIWVLTTNGKMCCTNPQGDVIQIDDYNN